MQMENKDLLIYLICWSEGKRIEVHGFIEALEHTTILKGKKKKKKQQHIACLCVQKAKHFSSKKNAKQ